MAPLGPYESYQSIRPGFGDKARSGYRMANERTVVANSIEMARTLPSLLSSRPPPEVKKAKFHLDAS